MFTFVCGSWKSEPKTISLALLGNVAWMSTGQFRYGGSTTIRKKKEIKYFIQYDS